MRNKAGIICMILGFALMGSALLLHLHNRREADSAGELSQEVLHDVVQQIPEEPDAGALLLDLTPPELLDPEQMRMTEVEINGYGYIGYLSMPSLKLELPIMADWDYRRLQIAPCRYAGTLRGNNLVLMAHNYASHFGRISELSTGDRVIFTDMDGVSTVYIVVGRDVLDPGAVEEMTAGHYDLTLFTCTYGGASRVTVYCDREME
jgi:sortase A